MKKKPRSKKKPIKKAAKKLKSKKQNLPEKFYDIKNPVEVNKMISQFKKFVTENKCVVAYEGKPYINISGWQFAGMLLGFTSKICSVRKEIAPIGELIYRAEVDLIDPSGKKMIESATMLCDSKEGYPTHSACASMAETRALSKAYRMTLGWIIQAAGFETTPAEEVGILKTGSGASEMVLSDFQNLFTHCNSVDEVLDVDQKNKKYKTNHLYKNAMTEAGLRCKEKEM